MFSSLKSLLNLRHRRTDLTHLKLLRTISMNLSHLVLLLVPHQLKSQIEMSSSMSPQTQEALELSTSQEISLFAQLHQAETLIHPRLHLAPMAPISEA